MKKSWLLTLLLTIPSVLAGPKDTIFNVWTKSINAIGDLGVIGLGNETAILGLTRILIWFLIFTIMFALINTFSKKKSGSLSFFNRGQGVVIAVIVATITTIFLPSSILLASSSGWAVLIALLLVGAPVVGLIYLIWKLPELIGVEKEGRGIILMKLLLCMILLWILSAMHYHVSTVFKGVV
jgi:hypothetical protein